MKKLWAIILSVCALAACDKHDPILPGTRTAIFANSDINILNTDIPNLSGDEFIMPDTNCPYTQDSSNTVWNGTRKIFSGFPTDNSVQNNQKPVCSGKYIYAGLTTGELVKINSQNRQVVWIADIYRVSNLTGGADILDIIAPIVIKDNFVYVGGLGDAFCKINVNSGDKKWCTNISVSAPFTIVNDVAFVPGSDKKLYAVRLNDGAIYWTHEIETITKPMYNDGVIIVGKQKINSTNGK